MVDDDLVTAFVWTLVGLLWVIIIILGKVDWFKTWLPLNYSLALLVLIIKTWEIVFMKKESEIINKLWINKANREFEQRVKKQNVKTQERM